MGAAAAAAAAARAAARAAVGGNLNAVRSGGGGDGRQRSHRAAPRRGTRGLPCLICARRLASGELGAARLVCVCVHACAVTECRVRAAMASYTLHGKPQYLTLRQVVLDVPCGQRWTVHTFARCRHTLDHTRSMCSSTR